MKDSRALWNRRGVLPCVRVRRVPAVGPIELVDASRYDALERVASRVERKLSRFGQSSPRVLADEDKLLSESPLAAC
jgi:hypothetical protein